MKNHSAFFCNIPWLSKSFFQGGYKSVDTFIHFTIQTPLLFPTLKTIPNLKDTKFF